MPASISRLQKLLEELNPSDDDYRPSLRELLTHQDLRSYVQGLYGSSLEGFIDLLEKVGKPDMMSTGSEVLTSRQGA